MRALWLQYPDDAKAVACGDQYLFGKNLLVAPVVEQGATIRKVYLPKGNWYDFWTNERMEGGREISREIALDVMPLYVRAGSILPLGPVKQYVSEKVDQALVISIYPGANSSFLLYEDDGASFDFRKGDWLGIQMEWNDTQRSLTLHLADGSRMLPPAPRNIEARLGHDLKPVVFTGKPVAVSF